MNLAQLSYERLVRYTLSRKLEDIDKAILHLTEAVLLPLPPLVDSNLCKFVLSCFFQLARSLFTRFHRTSQPEDLKYSVDYFRHLYHSDLVLDPVGVPRRKIIIAFVKALGTRVELEVCSATVTQTFGEMVAVCSELLLISNISRDDLVDSIFILMDSFPTALDSDHLEAIDQFVELIREAIPRCPPGSHRVSYALAQILTTRTIMKSLIEDSQEAITLFDKIAASQSLGDEMDPSRSDALHWAAIVAYFQFALYQNLENLEEAISRVRTAFADSSLEDIPELTWYLEKLMKAREEYFLLTEHPQMVSSGPEQKAASSSLQQMSSPDEGWIGWDATWDVQTACSMTTIERQIQLLQDLISSALPGMVDHWKYLEALADWYKAKFKHTDDTTDLEKSIEWRKIALASAPTNDWLMSLRLDSLAFNLLLASFHNHSISFLEELISLLHYILKLQGTQGWRATSALRILRHGLIKRFLMLRHQEDLDEAVLLLQMSIDDKCTIPPDKLRDACIWAYFAQKFRHPSVSTAYETTMSWIQTSLLFAPTLHTQHAHLVAAKEANKIPLQYASHQVQTGCLEEAVQTLERGRTLLWSEMRGLRTSIDELSSAHPALATKLTIINQDIEAVMMSVPLGLAGDIEEDSDVLGEGGTADPFSILLKRQQTLLNERDALIYQIQGLPGLGNFKKMPLFDMLRTAAS